MMRLIGLFFIRLGSVAVLGAIDGLTLAAVVYGFYLGWQHFSTLDVLLTAGAFVGAVVLTFGFIRAHVFHIPERDY